MGAKAQEKLKSEKSEEVAFGTKLISKMKMAGATYAAKAALLTSQKLEAKYKVAAADYAQKAAIASAAVAVHGERDATTLLPSGANMTNAAEKQAAATVSELRHLYNNAVKGFRKDQTQFEMTHNQTTRLRESLSEADKRAQHAQYEHKYAAQLHKTLVKEELTRAITNQNALKLKLKKQEQLVESYHAEELAEDVTPPPLSSPPPSAITKATTKVNHLLKPQAAKPQTLTASKKPTPKATKKAADMKHTYQTLLGDVTVVDSESHPLMGESIAEMKSKTWHPPSVQGHMSKPKTPWYHTLRGKMSTPTLHEAEPFQFRTIIGKISKPSE